MQQFTFDCLIVNRDREIVVRDTSSEVDPAEHLPEHHHQEIHTMNEKHEVFHQNE